MVTLIRYKVSKQKVSKVIDNVSKRTISMLAKELSVNVETIRFYERKGLIKQAPKPMQGYRHYPKETVNRIHFIKRSQELGFTLNEIEGLLALNDSPCSKVQELAVAARLIILSDPILSALPDPQSLTLSYGDGSH